MRRTEPRYEEDYDEDNDYSSNPKGKKGGGASQNDGPPAPEPIIYEDLIEQFREEYAPAPFEEEADEQMDFAGMREYFGAWPQYGYPDAIPAYIEQLRRFGFHLKPNFEHQPTLFLKRKEIPLVEEFVEL